MSIEQHRKKPAQKPAGNAGTPQTEGDPRHQAMTQAQASRLASLAAEVGETFDSGLSKAEAARRIDELQHKTSGEQPKAIGGDGGTSIRANESASGEDTTPPRIVTP